MDYDFFAPQHIAFGWGRIAEVGTLAATLGRRAFLIAGSKTLKEQGAFINVQQRLKAAGVEVVRIATISREPEVSDVDDAVKRLLEHDPTPGDFVTGLKDVQIAVKLTRNGRPGNGDFVLGIGGGSAMDLAKAVAAMATNRQGESVQDFLEGVGKGLAIDRDPLPVMVLPTTAGTGSEATKNAVISSYDPPFKKSLRSNKMVPNVVLVDPQLTVSVPPMTTAYTGMDAITQLIESYLSKRSKPIPDALCLSGLRDAVPSLVQAVKDGTNRKARETLSHAALLSGMALANSGLGFAHGVAAALGVHSRVPHGLACAVMLPAALRINAEVSKARLPALASALTGIHIEDPDAAAKLCMDTLETLANEIGIPRKLSEIGVRADQIPDLVTSSRGNSMSANPREVSDHELQAILEDML
jgi:alcohol dehydrogenase class IV